MQPLSECCSGRPSPAAAARLCAHKPPAPRRPDSPPSGGTFGVQWECLCDLPFQRTLHLQNPWNEGKPVKIARDGQARACVRPRLGPGAVVVWGGWLSSLSLLVSASPRLRFL